MVIDVSGAHHHDLSPHARGRQLRRIERGRHLKAIPMCAGLVHATHAAVGPGEISALRRHLFGPWIDAMIEVDLLREGHILVRRSPEISGLQLDSLSIADGTRTGVAPTGLDGPHREQRLSLSGRHGAVFPPLRVGRRVRCGGRPGSRHAGVGLP
ncbi:hypothetical protein [Streptomyces sp. WSLK1-4]|uniref:hypothetical protein n=1 Tax=Streptomyces sp. WSLK1-4 TaxID=3375474 RepID=UPI0037DA0BD0